MLKQPLNRFAGASLIELAFGLLILAIALIPIVLINSHSAGISTDSATMMSKEKSIANTLMEQATGQHPAFMALLEEYKVYSQNVKDPYIQTELKRIPSSRIYYRWLFKNISNSVKDSKRLLPNGNYLIEVTLQLFNERSLKENDNPAFVLATKVLIQRTKETFIPPKIGIIILLDMTPSMSMSKWGWGHNPMRIPNINDLTPKKPPERKDIPVFNASTAPKEVLNYINKWCMPEINYSNSFGSPNLEYTTKDDFIFGSTYDSSLTDFNEKFLPQTNIIDSSYYATGFSQGEAKTIATTEFNKLKSLSISYNDSIVDSSISRTEIVRSGLYMMTELLEQGEAGNTERFKIGIIPFTDTINDAQILQPESTNKNGKFPKLKQYIKSINRENAPIKLTFKMPAQGDQSTNISQAIQKADEILKKDETLTERIIVLVTDWNPCIEPPKYLDVKPCRECIEKIILELEAEQKEIQAYLAQQKKDNPKYVEDPTDKYHIRLQEIDETATWFKILVEYPPKETANSSKQPYFPLIKQDVCTATKESPILNNLVQNINKGDQNSNLYIFALVDAARTPSDSIFKAMTNYSEKGEFLSTEHIGQIPELFYYLVLELNRIVTIEETKRYAWNKK